MEEHISNVPVNSVNYEEQQKIRTKNLELTRALQDVDRLTSDNVQFKLEIIELKSKLNQIKDLLDNTSEEQE
tara:strand:- start:3242 stop:3457 length:216 start_codon:yes stop_codon:yes gene_type:complete